MKVVHIIWMDSTSPRQGWRTNAEIEEFVKQDRRVDSVGMVTGETGETISLIQTVTKDHQHNAIKIPKASIKKMIELGAI